MRSMAARMSSSSRAAEQPSEESQLHRIASHGRSDVATEKSRCRDVNANTEKIREACAQPTDVEQHAVDRRLGAILGGDAGR
jgi:hypothetical protein